MTMIQLDDKWFTEACHECGTAFSLRIEEKVHDVQTEFQRIEVYRTAEFGHLMTIDGYVMLSTRDNFLYHEMMSHPTLFTHPDPQNVVIIGGGDCGTLREVLRHAEVKRVTQIDIDEGVTRASELYFPELCESNHDPRATLLFEDGIKWMREAAPESVEVIIVDGTDPIGPGEVLFTAEFYQACFNALKPGGLIVQQSESPLLHVDILKRVYRHTKGSGFADVRTLFFPQPVYPSGWWSATMAKKGGAIDGFREEAVRNCGFPTQYYNEEIHRAAFAMPQFFKRALGL
jgi:spermidine synthase